MGTVRVMPGPSPFLSDEQDRRAREPGRNCRVRRPPMRRSKERRPPARGSAMLVAGPPCGRLHRLVEKSRQCLERCKSRGTTRADRLAQKVPELSFGQHLHR